MNKKIIYGGWIIIILMVLNFYIFASADILKGNLTLSYKLTGEIEDTYQVFYANDEEWTEENSITQQNNKINDAVEMIYSIPNDIKKIRLDLGGAAGRICLEDIKLTKLGKSVMLDLDKFIEDSNHNDIQTIKSENATLDITSSGSDPYIIYTLDDEMTVLNKNVARVNDLIKLCICLIIDFIGVAMIIKSNTIMTLGKELNSNRDLIWNLAKNDFKTKYAGSYLGITWAFVQPIVTIVVYWFVFEFGLKSASPMIDVPFIIWFSSGLIPWFFFQDAIINSTNCMMEYSYLVKQVLFKISILPLVKIISAVFVHLVFLVFLFVIASIYGFTPSIYSIQVIYYAFCTFCMALAISYATSAMIVFFKDLGQLISIFLQIGMWMTPIMWSYTILPENLRWVAFINPMCYIVEGYRDTFINKIWFFENYILTIYFWAVVVALFVVGAIIFKKLKPHFADVL